MNYYKLKKYFGWKPKHKFIDTINEVYNCYLNNTKL